MKPYFTLTGKILIFIAILSLPILMGITSMLPTKEVTEEVPCYDRYGNEIQGQVCNSYSYPIRDDYQWIGYGFLSPIFTSMLAVLCGIIGWLRGEWK